MSEIARWDLWDGQMSQSVSGLWVRYAAHEFEVERLATELAEAHERCGALELAAEQADEMKAHAEASAAAEEAETDRVTAERDAAQAEVDRLTQELDGRRATNQRVIAERDAARAEVARLKDHLFPWATYKQLKDAKEHVKEHVAKLTAERDAAQVEVERLTAERDEAQAEVKRLQILLRCERNELSTLRDCLRVPMDHARQAEARRGSRLSRNEEEGRDE